MKISIQDKLKESGMSRYELAKRLSVTFPTIDKIYKGTTTSIKFEILENICKELNCSPDEILIFDDPDLKEKQVKRLSTYYSKLRECQSKGDAK